MFPTVFDSGNGASKKSTMSHSTSLSNASFEIPFGKKRSLPFCRIDSLLAVFSKYMLRVPPPFLFHICLPSCIHPRLSFLVEGPFDPESSSLLPEHFLVDVSRLILFLNGLDGRLRSSENFCLTAILSPNAER